jgi:hypothetical protein
VERREMVVGGGMYTVSIVQRNAQILEKEQDYDDR